MQESPTPESFLCELVLLVRERLFAAVVDFLSTELNSLEISRDKLGRNGQLFGTPSVSHSFSISHRFLLNPSPPLLPYASQ